MRSTLRAVPAKGSCPLLTNRLSAVSGPPALDYHSKSGMSGVEPPAADAANSRHSSCSRSRCATICTSARLFSVRTAATNPASMPIGARTGDLQVPDQARSQASPRSDRVRAWGSRTQTLPGFVVPAPIRWTGHCVRKHRTQWAGRCSNPPLRLFRPALHRLSYQPQRKKPGVLVTPGCSCSPVDL